MGIEPKLNKSYSLLGRILVLPLLFFVIAMTIAYTKSDKIGYGKKMNYGEVEKEIEKQNQQLNKAIENGKAEEVAQYFITDAELRVEDGSIIKGRKNIELKIRELIKDGLAKISISSTKLLSKAEMLEMEEEVIYGIRDDSNRFKMKSVSVWKKEEGQFKLFKKSINYDKSKQQSLQ